MAKRVKVGDRVLLLRDDRPGVMAPESECVGKVGTVTHVTPPTARWPQELYRVDLGWRWDTCEAQCLEVLP